MLYKIEVMYNNYYSENTISVKATAKFETLVKKIATSVYNTCKQEIPLSTKYHFERPNVWTNGGFPHMWFECNSVDPVCDVVVTREDGCKVFIL